METFSALLAICAGNSPVPGEFSTQRPVTRSFDVFFDMRQNKRLSKQWWGWWFETLSRQLWRHLNRPKYGDVSRRFVGWEPRAKLLYSDVTWSPWRLKSPTVLYFVQRLHQTWNKETIKTSHYKPFVSRIKEWPFDSLQKGPVMRKVFPYCDIIMKVQKIWIKGQYAIFF